MYVCLWISFCYECFSFDYLIIVYICRPIRPSVGSSKHHIRSSRSSSTSNHIDSDNISTKRGSSIAARPIHFDELTLNKFKKIAMSMISALCILRHEGIIHGDIKLENVFINSKDHPSSSCSSINANGNGNGNGLSSSSSTVNATASGKNTIKLNHDDSQYQQQSESSHNIHHQTHTTSNSSSSSSISNSHKRSRVLSDQYDSAISESKSGLAFSSPSNHNTKPISSPTTGYTAPSSSSSSSSYIPTEQYTHSHTSTLSWVPSKHSLSDLPTDFEVLLGDFGNAIHISEASQYHTDFELQSLPYRAPEVLIGHPFSTQIDMWSVGVALVELCSGQPLFVATSREELCAQIGELIAPWPQQRFAGGRYSSILRSHVSASSSQSSAQSPMVSTIVSAATTTATTSHDSASKSQYQSSPVNLSIAPSLSSSSQVASSLVSSFTLPSPSHHLVCIRKLFDQFGVQNVTDDMVDFIGELLQLHPDNRMTPYDALQHPFLLNSQSYQVPISLFHLEYMYGSQVQSQSNLQFVAKKKENAALVSLGRLRKSFSSKR